MSITPTNSRLGPPVKAALNAEDDILQDTRPSFAVLATPAKGEFALRYQRQDTTWKDAQGHKLETMEIVIIKTRENTSNLFYIGGYNPDVQHRPPDCWASDGKVPDKEVPLETKQHATCAGCPQKKPGTAHTAKGFPITACADTRKVAIVPLAHLLNRQYESYGGPMLLTIKISTLRNYANYLTYVRSIGHRSFSVATLMGFEPTVKHQKLTFKVLRALTEEEYSIVEELRNDPRTANILSQEPALESGISEDDTDEVILTQQDTKPRVTTAAQKVTSTPASAPTPTTAPIPKRAQERTTETVTQFKSAPKPGGFAATPQDVTRSVAEAVNKPAPRPASTRPLQQVPTPEEVEEELDEEVLDDNMVDDLSAEVDDELKRLLS